MLLLDQVDRYFVCVWMYSWAFSLHYHNKDTLPVFKFASIVCAPMRKPDFCHPRKTFDPARPGWGLWAFFS